MASWNSVQSSFNIDDETINFGTRILAENNDSLYEACTVAVIRTLEKVEQQPHVVASIQYSKICIAIDKSIIIFKDETCDEILCNISFPSIIASYCISKDGYFLFVILTTRILYCLHLSDGKIIFTKIIPDNKDNIIEIFLKEQRCEDTFIILVTNAGTIYRFSKFYPKALEIAFTSNDTVTLEKYIADIQCSQLFKGFTTQEFLNATTIVSSEQLLITIVGKNSIFTWPDEQYVNFQSVFSFGYKKIKPLYGSNKMLCLRTDNILNIICLNTFLTLKIYDDSVFDFDVIQYDDHCEILLLTHSKDNYTTYILRVISYPDFEQKLEINVSTSTYLLNVLYNAPDNLFYIEGVINNETDIINEFRIKMILESIPEIRLARLLRKKQFDAAEAFAEKLNLSMETIYCSKAVLLVEQLSPWAKSTPDLINVDTLINILNKIQSVQFVIECCNKALISDYAQMRRIYSYARQRIVQNIKINTDDSLNTSLSVINDALYRLETFQMIHDHTETNTFLNDDASVKEWIRFSQANLLEEYTTCLSMGQLKSATLIWTRHLPDFVKHISMQTVQNIFTILPEDMDPSCLWPWLIHFIPTLLSLLPDAINEIISWSLRKLKYLEISHHTIWPEIGTEFAKKFTKLLKFEDNQLAYFHQEYRKHQNSLLKQFMVLFQALSDLQQLKIVYRLRISLDIYIDSPVEAIYMLLDKIHIDQISSFANTFLKQYIFNNNLQNDTVFCTYIQKTIKNSYSWWFNEGATWEKRVTIIINLIHNIEKRLEQTLIVLRKAPVPWSSIIATLAETSINYDHSLSYKIKIECDYVPIKLILKKYGYATIGVNNRLMSRIIKENCDSMINDIDVLTKNDPQLRQDAFCRCINIQLNEKNLQKAMDILYYLENDAANTLYYYEGIINYIIAAFSFQNAITSLTYHMEILSCLEFKIYNLLTQSNVCPYRCNNIIKIIKDLKSLYALKKYYKIDISLKDYHMQKSLLLQNYISKLLPNIKENWSIIHKTIFKIAELLGLEKSYATLFMLEQMENLTNLNRLEKLVDDDLNIGSEKFKNVCKICLSILQHPTVDTNTVKIVKNLSVSTLNTCQDDDLQSALMLYIYINGCPNFSTQDCFDVKLIPQSNWKLYTIYKDQAISLDEKLLFLFKDSMSLHLYYSNKINTNEITNCDEQMNQLLTSFLKNIRKMQPQHNDYSLLQIFKTFYFMYYSTSVRCDEEILTEMKCILSQLLMNLLRKLCTARLFDLQLGLSVLFMLSEQEACSWLSTVSASFQADHIRHCTISTLGYEYSRLMQNRSLMETFKKYKLLHIWARRLSHYSITSKEVFINSASSIREILQKIIDNNKENVVPLLKDYCYSFGSNFNDCLLNYLEVLLKTWNPTITISNSVNKELLICKEEIDELRKKCNTIVAQMEDISLLKRRISTLRQQISFYHYEVFIILMDVIEDKDMEKRNYLCFLQNYTRSGPPTSIEHDEWTQLNPGHSIPPIAQWRLPFLPKVDIWKIITPELNLKTYDKWLEIAPVLNLEAHLICSLAIKGEVTKVWGNNSTTKNTTWSLYSRNTTLLKDSKKCIQRLTNSDGFYYGTAALYHIVNYTPPGADRVAAAKECYEYAQLAARNSTKFEGKELEVIITKIKFKYLTFTTEHILRTYGLDRNEYLALIEDPDKLVYNLYNDKSIPLRYRTATNYRPDINTAVNELGKLFSLNTIKLRMDLLEEWLQSNARYNELFQSFTETFLALKESDQNTDCEDNLLRICYMLEYGDMDLFAQILINIGFGDHGKTEYNCNVRYRVFQILQTVVDIPTLEELTKQDIHTFRKYMKSLQYIVKLESLGLCYSVDTFEACCKRELVQILWKSQRHLPYVLSVIAQICIEFEINDILLWDDILSQMTKLRMVSDLKKILLQLRNKNVIVNCNGYKTGWQLIIFEPFNEMDINPNLEQIENCIEAICLLYSCPMAHELDFTVIVRNCFQSQQTHLAAALLPFLNDTENKFVLETINQKCQIEKLVEDLNDLFSKGVLTITHSLAMVQKSIP